MIKSQIIWPGTLPAPVEKPSEPKPRRKRRGRYGDGSLYRAKVKDPRTGKVEEVGPYRIRFYVNGKRQSESTRTLDYKAAKAHLTKRLDEVQRGEFIAGTHRVTLKGILAAVEADYEIKGNRSLVRLRQSIKALLRHFGDDTPAMDITPAAIQAYIAARLKGSKEVRPVAIGTARNDLAILRRAFRLAVRQGRLAVRQEFDMPPAPAPRKDFFEADQLERVIAHLPDYLAAPFRFLALTGWRKEEAHGLTWREVDLEARVIRIEGDRTKNGEPHTLPYGQRPDIQAIIEAQRERVSAIERAESRIVPWVFPGRNHDRIKNDHKARRAACKAAGCPGKWTHDLRRSAVRAMEREGVPRSFAMAITGHKTESIYKRYAIVDERNIGEWLGRMYKGPATQKARKTKKR